MPKTYSVTRSDAEWRALLTQEQFQMLREQGAERPGTSALVHEKRPGIFSCAAAGNALARSSTVRAKRTGFSIHQNKGKLT